jgi:23S rRNA A2030 N6-methylase RlmJ
MESLFHSEDRTFLYAESHAGYPRYQLGSEGRWKDGIGKCIHLIEELSHLAFFRLFSLQNPQKSQPWSYLGSAGWVHLLALESKVRLSMRLWDISREVVSQWRELNAAGVTITLGDGFRGVEALLRALGGGVIFLDPPYMDVQRDRMGVENIFSLSAEKGWIALCWSPLEVREPLGSPLQGLQVEIAFDGTPFEGRGIAGVRMNALGLPPRAQERVVQGVESFLSVMRCGPESRSTSL